ncbi:MAG: mucoidy inhibitor MuiA family protein [Cyanobacteriota bacterium]|nr:mucoidy inhibitor MuiA family protein [Cyanobacteriota bacterium]
MNSKIDKVKLYAAGATVTRVAELAVTDGKLPEKVEINGLPLALDDGSVRVRVEAEGDNGSNGAIATDIRIGLSVPERQETTKPPLEEELRGAKAEVERLQDTMDIIEYEKMALDALRVADRPKAEAGKPPTPSPLGMRLAIANFKDEQIGSRIKEKRETEKKFQEAVERWRELEQQQAKASSANEVKKHELKKTAIVTLSYSGSGETAGQRLVLEYFVPGARWTPTYVCRLDSKNNSADIAVRALISQRTGEDWSGVRLELSTARPTNWCELPELPELRLGRARPQPRQPGWRLPPVGAEVLFEDFDRQKQQARAGVKFQEAIEELTEVEVPRLSPILRGYSDLEALLETEEEEDNLDLGLELEEELEDFLAPAAAALEMKTPPRPPAPPPPGAPPLPPRSLRGRGAGDGQEVRRARKKRPTPEVQLGAMMAKPEEAALDLLAYGLMRAGSPDNEQKRGKLTVASQEEIYLQILRRRRVEVKFEVMSAVGEAQATAANCVNLPLPPGGTNVRQEAGSFDYAYIGTGRIDVPSDGEFHSVALLRNSTDVEVRYIVLPRIDTNVFRIAQLLNPLEAPLLAGAVDVYVDGEYILSTNIETVPPRGKMELGLGVEQAIKVARNTTFSEVRSGETLVAFNELQHQIKIDIANRMPRPAPIEVRERLPVPQEGEKVDVAVRRVSPEWENYEQEERNSPIKGGYRWQVEVAPGETKTLSVDYTVKTFVDSELIGGNRRED